MKLRTLFAIAVALFVGLFSTVRLAHAAGSVKAESAAITEEDGKWKLKLVMDYGGTPEINFIPMSFIFEQTMLYERALTDESGDKPVVTKKALQNQTPIIEGMDVGFSDGTGKVFKTTKFNFLIRRDRGFEAGEYTLTIKKADGGQQIGQKLKLILNGDNPVINRKSITFVDDKGKPDNDPSKVKSKSLDNAKEVEKEKQEAGSGSDGGTDNTSTEGGDPAGQVPPKQGGCGCEVPSASTSGYATPALLGLAFLVPFARRRQKKKTNKQQGTGNTQQAMRLRRKDEQSTANA